MRTDMSDRALPVDFIDDASLVLTELISNALRHARPLAGGGVQVAWRFGSGHLEVAVTDGGSSSRPHVAPAVPDSLGGRGLTIVSALSVDWGTRRASGESTVWARLALVPGAAADRIAGSAFSGGHRVRSEEQSGAEFADEFARQFNDYMESERTS
jgi:hypothetical protein